MKKHLLISALCAASSIAYASDAYDQTAAPSAHWLSHTQPQSESAIASGALKSGNHIDVIRPADEPASTRVVGHTQIEIGDQVVTLSIVEKKFPGGYVSQCTQYVRNYAHDINADRYVSPSLDTPSDITTIRLGYVCDKPTKG